MDGNAVHVLPVNDLIEHEAEGDDFISGELLVPIDPAMFVHVPMGWGG